MEEGRCCTHTSLQLQPLSPCHQLCNVNMFCCTVQVSHKAKAIVGVNMPGGILRVSVVSIAFVGQRLV